MTTIVAPTNESNVGFVITIIILSIIALGATALAIYFIVIISDPDKFNQKNVKKTQKQTTKNNKVK